MNKKTIVISCVLAVSVAVGTAGGAGFIKAKNVKNNTVNELKPIISNKASEIRQSEENPSYVKDNSTEVLIDAPEVSTNDILKIIKHGDHWHVFTKDGREIITYKDPTKIKNAGDLKDAVNMVSKEALKKINGNEVVEILKHGDHYHIYTADGREFITHDDPSSVYPNIKIGKYTGEHNKKVKIGNMSYNPSTSLPDNKGLNFVPILDEKNLNDKDEIVKILKHGDHYHIYTKSGKESIVYKDPRAYFPDAFYGEYEGEHGKINDKRNMNFSDKDVKPEKPSKPQKNIEGLSFIEVVGLDKLKTLKIRKILKHGNHYHVYTENGTEYITYENPSFLFPAIRIGEYNGTHGNDDKISDLPKPKPDKLKDGKKVVRIEKHEDHWHIHFEDGTEKVSFNDPSKLYPNIKIEDYDENHGHNFKPLEENEKFTYDDVEAKLIVPLEYIKYGNVIYTTGFDYAKQRFIIPHQSHYHYASIDTIIQFSKPPFDEFHGYSARDVVATLKYLVIHPEARPKDKDEWGSNADIKVPGDTGNTGGGASHSEEPELEITIKRIVKTDRYWTLYFSDNTQKIVYKNPSKDYPHIKIEEIKENAAVKTDKEIIKEYSKLYGMTEEEFEDAIFDLPPVPLGSMVFNNDGTVVIHGEKYDFRSGEIIK